MVKLSGRSVVTGLGLYFAAAVSGYLYLRSAKAPAPSPCGCGGRHGEEEGEEGGGGAPADGQATFDRLADFYDSSINIDETFMGLKLMRRWLVRHAEVGTPHGVVASRLGALALPIGAADCRLALALHLRLRHCRRRVWCSASSTSLRLLSNCLSSNCLGRVSYCLPASSAQGDVLEVSAGTGRNLPYYDLSTGSRLRSLTLTDTSRPMLVNAAGARQRLLRPPAVQPGSGSGCLLRRAGCWVSSARPTTLLLMLVGAVGKPCC